MTDTPRQWPGDGPGQPVPPWPSRPPSSPVSGPEWFDDEAGPLVRLYAMTAGRARPARESFDLAAIIHAAPGEQPAALPSHEHAAIVALCRSGGPRSVADIAADSDLPVGVLRVLLDDLLNAGHIHVTRPVSPAHAPSAALLKDVIDGLRAL